MAVVEVPRKGQTVRFEAALETMRSGVRAFAAWVEQADDQSLGEGLI
jgi:hypothetical protein